MSMSDANEMMDHDSIDEDEMPAHPLCTSCLTPYTESIDFCPTCLAPLGLTVAIDPLKRIWATGFIYRQAVYGPTSKITLLGMWLIFCPELILGLLILPLLLFESHTDVGALLFLVGFGLIKSIIPIRATLNFLQKHPSPPGNDAEND